MAGTGDMFEVTCPHCRRTFTAERLDDPSGRPGGFKCKHCRLFVPHGRVAESRRPVEPAS